MDKALNDAILAAHDAGDRGQLITLYQRAADACVAPDEQAFFLTISYIYALELDHPDAVSLAQELAAQGRL